MRIWLIHQKGILSVRERPFKFKVSGYSFFLLSFLQRFSHIFPASLTLRYMGETGIKIFFLCYLPVQNFCEKAYPLSELNGHSLKLSEFYL